MLVHVAVQKDYQPVDELGEHMEGSRDDGPWRWVDMRDISFARWRKEDAEMINQYLKREGRGMLSSPNIQAAGQWGARGHKGGRR